MIGKSAEFILKKSASGVSSWPGFRLKRK